jgi:hypothetical protein
VAFAWLGVKISLSHDNSQFLCLNPSKSRCTFRDTGNKYKTRVNDHLDQPIGNKVMLSAHELML